MGSNLNQPTNQPNHDFTRQNGPIGLPSHHRQHPYPLQRPYGARGKFVFAVQAQKDEGDDPVLVTNDIRTGHNARKSERQNGDRPGP